MSEEMVTITKKEYEELLDSQWMLICLENAGVDNWHGYYKAQKRYHHVNLKIEYNE